LGTTADGSVVANLALGELATGADARIAALEVEAGELVIAVVVVLALALLAEDEGIPLVAGRALAVGVVTVPDALGVCAAGAWVARVGLLLAAGDGVGVGDVACDALAHWVAATVHITASVWSARAWIARVWRRSPHHNSRAAGDRVGSRFEAVVAGAHGVALPVHVALGVPTTRGWVARVGPGHALVVLANVAGGAVRVSLALSAAPGDGVRLGDVVGEASADRVAVRGHRALCVRPTWTWVAWVRLDHTPLALTDVTALAIGIPHTFRSTASDGVRLRNETRLATTDGISSKVDRAHSSRAARAWDARVGLLDALLVLTDVTALAVRVSHTLWFAARNSVRVWDQTRFASADGVA